MNVTNIKDQEKAQVAGNAPKPDPRYAALTEQLANPEAAARAGNEWNTLVALMKLGGYSQEVAERHVQNHVNVRTLLVYEAMAGELNALRTLLEQVLSGMVVQSVPQPAQEQDDHVVKGEQVTP